MMFSWVSRRPELAQRIALPGRDDAFGLKFDSF